jgi:hypothetical protein
MYQYSDGNPRHSDGKSAHSDGKPATAPMEKQKDSDGKLHLTPSVNIHHNLMIQLMLMAYAHLVGLGIVNVDGDTIRESIAFSLKLILNKELPSK